MNRWFKAAGLLALSLALAAPARAQIARGSGAHDHSTDSRGGANLYPDTITADVGTFGTLILGAEILPVGTILPYASSSVPVGFYECDGSTKSVTTDADLYAVIGCAWGCSGSEFSLPDMRGQFPRGWDHGAGTDPDAATRTASATGGSTGDNVGTLQGDELAAHTHTGNMAQNTVNADGASAGFANSFGGYTGSTGGNETRPVNASVMFIIKYQSQLDGSTASTGTYALRGGTNTFTAANDFVAGLTATDLRVRGGTGTSSGTVPVLLYTWTGSSSTAGDLSVAWMLAKTYTVPANTLVNDGDGLRVYAIASATSTSLSKGVRCDFNGDSIENNYNTTSKQTFRQENEVYRTSSANLRGWANKGYASVGGAPTFVYDIDEAMAWDSTAANDINCYIRSDGTGNTGVDVDMDLWHLEVWLVPAP